MTGAQIALLAVVAGCFGFVAGAVAVGLIAISSKPTPCSTCGNSRIVVYAGDLERDEGYCELRSCPTCSDGQRLGRSDVPILSDYSAIPRIDPGPR